MHHEDNIGKMLGFLHKSAQKYFHNEFMKYELGSGAHMLLVYLFHNNGATQNEISSHLNVDKSHITRIVQKLLKLGFITKEHDLQDNRVYRIFLTEKSYSIKTSIQKSLLSWTELISRGFSEQELKQMKDFLNRMSENVNNYMEYKQL